MRIDAPRGNESILSGSFSGSFVGKFTGDLDGLSGSIERIYEKIDEVSKSIDEQILIVSGNISGTIDYLSGSFKETIVRDSGSISQSINDISHSFSGTIGTISHSFSGTIDSVSHSYSGTIGDISHSFSGTIDFVSNSCSTSLGIVSESFSGSLGRVLDTVYELSGSFDETIDSMSVDIEGNIQEVSRSFATTIHDTSKSIDETIRTYKTTESFDRYSASADETYYKSGSEATLQKVAVESSSLFRGDVYIQGNLNVEGSSSTIHSQDVYIKDKFVEIASGTTSPEGADGAGFGIQGADVSMSYVYNHEGGYMELNKPLVSPSFTGSLRGNVVGDVEGNVTGDLEGTASYAGEVGDDGTIARSIKRLENVARISTSSCNRNADEAEFVLSCCSHKNYQSCSVGSSNIKLTLPTTVVPGVEHYLLISNTGSVDCLVEGSEGIMVPPSVISKYHWEYKYQFKYKNYTVPDVYITASQTIPSKQVDVFNGKIDGGGAWAVTGSRKITLDQINIAATATVPTPLTSSFVVESGSGGGSSEYEDKFKVPVSESLCLSYFTAGPGTVIITSAVRLKV